MPLLAPCLSAHAARTSFLHTPPPCLSLGLLPLLLRVGPAGIWLEFIKARRFKFMVKNGPVTNFEHGYKILISNNFTNGPVLPSRILQLLALVCGLSDGLATLLERLG